MNKENPLLRLPHFDLDLEQYKADQKLPFKNLTVYSKKNIVGEDFIPTRVLTPNGSLISDRFISIKDEQKFVYLRTYLSVHTMSLENLLHIFCISRDIFKKR